MKIVIVSPLYPPDIAQPAPYVKELGSRLSGSHEIVVVTYGSLPELVRGVHIVTVPKHTPLFMRLFSFTRALMREAKDADVIYLQNGASAELPAGIVARLTRTPLVAHIVDAQAHENAARHPLLGFIEHFAIAPARAIVEDMPMERPEILPLEAYPKEAFLAYEKSWDTHTKKLEQIFSHAR